VSENDQWLLEIRLFTLCPGARAEFHRVSREGTIPLMRKCGITVIAHGPSLNDDNGYFLLRAFRSDQERAELSESFYATQEWTESYEKQIMGMMADYHTAVVPAAPQVIEQLTAGLPLR
jgi:NIPSNAP